MASEMSGSQKGLIKSEDSAELLVYAVESGHQPFTSVCSPSAIGIVTRLRSLGVSNDVSDSPDLGGGE